MNKPLLITKRQAKVLFEAAREAGGRIDINPETRVISLIPDVLAGELQSLHDPRPGDEDGLDRELAEFEAKHGDDRA